MTTEEKEWLEALSQRAGDELEERGRRLELEAKILCAKCFATFRKVQS